MSPARRLSALLLAFIGMPLLASVGPGLQPFRSDSLTQITADHAGRPFVLLLWSVECPPCLQELGQLRDLGAGVDGADLVLVATDGPARRDEVVRLMQELELGRFDNWLFADAFGQRLRFAIDPDWFGELPRAYFYDAGHRRSARSGIVGHQLLTDWLRRQDHADPGMPAVTP